MALRADGLGCEAELIAEGASEGFVRTVAGFEGDGKDVWRASREGVGGLGKAAASDIGCDGEAGGCCECPGHVEAGDAGYVGNVIKGEFLCEVGFDEPEGFGDGIHNLPFPYYSGGL